MMAAALNSPGPSLPVPVTQPAAVFVGRDAFRFAAHDHWERCPPGFSWSEATSVACDSHDRVFVFNRGEHPVMVFDRHGSFLQSWGEGQFVRPHGITIGPDDSIYCTDDSDHTVKKFSAAGRLLLTLGTSGKPAPTGATSVDFRTILRSAWPFHFPTNVALGPGGEIFAADGYGNARIHKFSPEGVLLYSWGEPGGGPGQFRIPHGIAVNRDGIVYVADRENSRIQMFSSDGRFLDQWSQIARPCQITFDPNGNLFVAELGYRAGMWPGIDAPSSDAPGGRISIYSPSRELLARWGGGDHPTAAGDFYAPHDLCLDSHGDLYVAEVTMSAGGNRGLLPADCHSLQKFVRLASNS